MRPVDVEPYIEKYRDVIARLDSVGGTSVCASVERATLQSVIDDLNNAPTVDTSRRVYEDWVWKHRHHGGFHTAYGKCECGRSVSIQVDHRYETDDPYCPACGELNESRVLNYCPKCGCKVVGKGEMDGQAD